MREDFIQEQKDGMYLVNGQWCCKSFFDHLQEITINGKNMLLEYYDCLSTKEDAKILQGFSVWVYGHDRENNPPHIHLILGNPSKPKMEVEVHLHNLEAYHMKAPRNKNITWNDLPKSLKNGFFKWLTLQCKVEEMGHLTNNQYLYTQWNIKNPTNTIRDFVEKKNLENNLHPLISMLLRGEAIKTEDISNAMFPIVLPLYQKDKEAREKLHRIALVDIIKFAQEVGLPFEFTKWNTTEKVKSVIKQNEKLCYELVIQK